MCVCVCVAAVMNKCFQLFQERKKKNNVLLNRSEIKRNSPTNCTVNDTTPQAPHPGHSSCSFIKNLPGPFLGNPPPIQRVKKVFKIPPPLCIYVSLSTFFIFIFLFFLFALSPDLLCLTHHSPNHLCQLRVIHILNQRVTQMFRIFNGCVIIEGTLS